MSDQTLHPQTRAADPKRSVFVSANAGSGKTTTLVSRVARLLLGGTAPGAILCVTFTKAAASEMQSRLFARLGSWAVMDDAKLSRELAALEGQTSGAYADEALSRARRLFARALETPGGLKIQTLHAFCEKLLRRFPMEAGVSPGFTVLEDEAARRLSREARDDLARAALADAEGPLGQAYRHFALALDFQAFEGFLTTLEAERLKITAWVAAVEAGEAPDIHTLTGTEPGVTAEGIEAEWLAALDPAELRALAAELATGSKTDIDRSGLLTAALEAGLTFKALGPIFLTRTGTPQKSMATQKIAPAIRDRLTALQDSYCQTLSACCSARTAERSRHAVTLAIAHAALYDRAKAATGALDFADLVDRTRALLTRSEAAAWVLYKMDGGIDHVLVDEAQDTAPDQWEIVTALTSEFFAGETRGRTVFAVGDEKQSIYSFQGARPERLRREAQAYDLRIKAAGSEFEGIELTTSYRSTPEVLKFVDAVFAAGDRARALTGQSLQQPPVHEAARTDHAGSVEMWPLFFDDEATPQDPWVPVDHEPATHGRKKLARALAREIRRAVDHGDAVYDPKGKAWRACGYDDFLILVRRRDPTFEEIIRALKAEGVPVAGADRLKLSSHIAFDDLKAVMRFALFPGDELSLAEMLRGPLCDLPDFDGPDSLYALAGRKRRGPLWDELQARAHEQPLWARAQALADWARSQRDRDAFGFVSGLLNRTDGASVTGRVRMLERLGREAEEALDETLSLILSLDRQGVSDLETVLDRLEAAEVEVKRDLEGPRGEVRIMTVHGAKGLEAPVVFLPDTTAKAGARGAALFEVAPEVGEGVTPPPAAWLMGGKKDEDCPALAAARAAREQASADESLRLLYVGLTRARDRLVIMGRGMAGRKDGFADGSWWDLICQTFDGLEGVHDLDDGRRRYGPAPMSVLRAVPTVPAREALPDWTHVAPPPDAGLRARAPSRLADVGEDAGPPSPSPLDRGRDGGLSRLRRGTLIHRLLERLPELPAGDRRAAADRLLAREPGLTPGQIAEMTGAAFGVLEDARFAAVFGPGSRAEVALTGTVQGIAWSGRMDRLVVLPDRVLVIDYKTQRPAPDHIDRTDPAHLLQMAAYVALLRRLYPERAVEAALVWTDGPRLMPVPDALIDEALHALVPAL
ncbi:MAG: double-strand break repair helicase AddA [Alphaproteobacteria bacterium]|nr:double-strand break repair helicase AddA [Alphaproteobacteria bacterium]